jgi:ketosteroid isomerase-like protein
MTPERALAAFEALADVHHSQDAARLRAVFTEDIEYDDDGWPETARGHAELLTFFRALWAAFPDFRVEIVGGPYVSGDRRGFSVHGRISATMEGSLTPPGLAPTGGRISSDFGGFYELEGERIRRGRVILNTYELGTQMGASPQPGSAGERLVVAFQRLQARRLRRRNRRAAR